LDCVCSFASQSRPATLHIRSGRSPGRSAFLVRQRDKFLPQRISCEDAHWTDPTSLEVFGRIVDRVRSLRVLLIVTFRPDFDPPWVERSYVTFLAINRGEREILAMIEDVIGNKPLAANIRQDIIDPIATG
jgi:predicted ATPase